MTEQAENKSATPIKGAELVIRCLEREGCDMIYAYPGGASMELHQAFCESEIRVVLPRHEQGGAFAAAGYARATGKTGVCMATSGPGATNLLTGIADAYMDSVPMVVITGQVPQSFIGKNAFQETDIIGMTRPIVKHSFLVLKAEEIPGVIAEAFYIANSGRPGPVVIDLPKDVQQKMVVPEYAEEVNLRAYSVKKEVSDAEIEVVRDAIEQSYRPCLYVGGGIITSEADKELLAVAEKFNIPVTTTLMGIGAFPEDHRLALKWLGMHGTFYANYAANEADLLICIGARFDDRVTGNVDTFAAKAKVVHIDIDPSEINKNKKADIGIIGDAKDFLGKLAKRQVDKDFSDWHKQVEAWKKQGPLAYKEDKNIQPQYVIQRLCEMTNSEAIVVTGVGQHQMWSGQFYTYKYPRQFITSGGLGTMGFGLPSAIGVKMAKPDSVVLNIDGDGSFQMNIQELGTAYCEEVGVKMIILNNQHLGMVAQWEDRFYGSRRGNTVLGIDGNPPYPDFVKIAEGYNIPGKHVWKKEELDSAIKEMLETDGPFILDIHVEYQEHVLPMIPSGKSYKDIIME